MATIAKTPANSPRIPVFPSLEEVPFGKCPITMDTRDRTVKIAETLLPKDLFDSMEIEDSLKTSLAKII